MRDLSSRCWLWVLLLTSIPCLFGIGSASASAVDEILIAPSPFKGFNGINFDPKGQLYVGSVIQQTTFRVNPVTGEYKVFLDRPFGQADDFLFTPNNQFFSTAIVSGEVRNFNPQTGKFKTIASNLSGINAIAQNAEGRIFVAQSLSLQNTGLYELDPTGATPPRLILNLPGLNAFEFGADGLLYSPLQFTGEIVRINVDTGSVERVASGLVSPGAVKFNSKGELFALDTATGQVLYVDTITGQIQEKARLQLGLDNLAFGSNDLLYATNFVNSDINEVNTETGKVRPVIKSSGLTFPGGIAAYGNFLYIADANSYRILDRLSGRILKTVPSSITPVQFPLAVSINNQNAITSSWFSGVVQRLNRETGEVLDTYTGFSVPYDAVELADNSIVVADCARGQLIQILDKDGSNRRTVVEGLGCPTGLAKVDDSTVLVTEFLSNKLSRINLATGERQVIATNLSSPEGVAYHSSGIAVVAEVGTRSLKAIHIKTGRSFILKKNLPIGFEGPPEGPPPYGLTGVAIAGNTVYVTADRDNSVRTVKLKKFLKQP